jgi:hypothetical protein
LAFWNKIASASVFFNDSITELMKTFVLLAVAASILTTASNAQEQRVTAKIRQANAERNAVIEKGTPPAVPGTTPTTRKTEPAKQDPIPDLATAEKALVYQLNVLVRAKSRVDAATNSRNALHATYKDKKLEAAAYSEVMKKYELADKNAAAAEKELNTAREAYKFLLDKYKGYGGTNKEYEAKLATLPVPSAAKK